MASNTERTRAANAKSTQGGTQIYYKEWGSKKLRATISAQAQAQAQALATLRIAPVAHAMRLEAHGVTRPARSRGWASHLMSLNPHSG